MKTPRASSPNHLPQEANDVERGTFVLLRGDATDEEIEAACRALGWTPEEEAANAEVEIAGEVEEPETPPTSGRERTAK